MSKFKTKKVRIPRVDVKISFEGDYCSDGWLNKQCPFFTEITDKRNLKPCCSIFGKLQWGPGFSSPPVRHKKCLKLTEK